jgi:Protein of unknown function (DUF935)
MVAVPQAVQIVEPDPRGEVLPVLPGYWLPSNPLMAAAGALVRTLPRMPDDLTRDFGLDIYDRMALDPQIHAGRRILVTAALNQPVQLSIPVPRQTDAGTPNPVYDRAAQYTAFVREGFRRLPVPLEATLFEMATGALTHGHSLAEKVEGPPTALLPGFGPLRVYADLKPRPMDVYAFVQDLFANTLGVIPRSGMVGVSAGGWTTYQGGMLAGDVPVYSLDHFALLTWDGRYRDPRGQSLLRAAFGAWWKKRQAEPGLLAYLARFGQPSLDLEMAPNTPDQQPDPVTGDLVKTKDLYLAMGKAYQAGGIQVRPAGSKSALQEAHGDGAAYIQAEALWNREISMALLGQTLATNEAQHESRAAATVHQDILALLIRYIKFWLADFVYHQLIVPWVRVNFGADAVALAPTVSLGQTDPENLAAVANAIAQMTTAGYWDPTRMPPDIGAQLDVRLNFPERQVTAIGPDGTPADAPSAAPAPADVNPEGVPTDGNP